MDLRCRGPEVSGERDEVGHVGSEDAVSDPRGEHCEMRVDDIPGARSAQQVTYGGVIVRSERMHADRTGDSGKPRLPRAVAPDLGQHRGGCVQGLVGSYGGRQKGTCRALATIQRDQGPRVEDHRSK